MDPIWATFVYLLICLFFFWVLLKPTGYQDKIGAQEMTADGGISLKDLIAWLISNNMSKSSLSQILTET